MFIILSGCSGSGKNTVINKIVEEDENKYELFRTYTTREQREILDDGKIFYFISKEEFQNKIKNNEFIEYEYIHGHYYGSSKEELERAMADGHILLKDIGVQGTQEIKNKIGEKEEVISVYLKVNKCELKRRLRDRKEKSSKLRLRRYKYENKFAKEYDYVVKNDNLDTTVEIIKAIADKTKVLFNVDFEKLNDKKIQKALRKIEAKEQLKPIKVVYKDGKFYCVKGNERLLASMVSNVNICKKIKVKKNFEPNDVNMTIYEQYIY